MIDSGVAPLIDYADRLVAWHDVSSPHSTVPVDPVGHGSISAGCVGGDGLHKGVAPDANIIGVRIKGTHDVEDALKWVIDNKDEYNIRVVNMSLGIRPADRHQGIESLCAQAFEAGLLICASMGNDSGRAPACMPAVLPNVIGVGAYDDRQTADLSDDDVASFSNHGDPGSLPIKPDVLAPGVDLMVPVPKDSLLAKSNGSNTGYMKSQGTSEAAPYVSGLAAILAGANPELSPGELGDILRNSASSHLDREPWEQGHGLVQADVALELALMASSKSA